MRHIISVILSITMSYLLLSCDDNEKSQQIAPISNITYEAGNGSILFFWNNPQIDELAYTEISYVDSQGKQHRILVNGKQTSQVIKGLPDNSTYEFTFLTYNTQGQAADPIKVMAAALEPYVNIFNQKIRITTAIGGININWDNEYENEFYITLNYSDVNGNEYKTEFFIPFQSNGTKYIPISSNITGTQTLDIYVTVKDMYGNTSPATVIKYHKVEVGKLDRSLWSVVDYSSQNNDAPATNVLDGKASTIWHALWQSDPQDRFPDHYITFDLGSKKRLEKAELQHRQEVSKDANGNEVIKAVPYANRVDFWGTNTNGKAPESEWSNFATFFMDQNDNAYNPQTVNFPEGIEYRYIKIQFVTPGKSNQNYAAISEFSLYGTDVLEN